MRKIGNLALVLGLALLAPLAGRAEGSEGEGLQGVAEAMRQAAVRDGGSGWQNGAARLVASGTGYGVAYSGLPRGSVGRGPLTVIGAMDGQPIVAYADPQPGGPVLLAERR
ncbi:hypothetical protein [Roseicella frigidaeris]|uniref:Uncharacterized protein n=1 Tax=Roseicella frigidaeris TaxID=2230885 RepID=A0A327M399_9PROT|nr:hypothetical protein [Roseicella frigidaeris]RAI57751.1 hypothetical protein DOO78_17180 [Roseicella frigidaeris]